MNRFRIILAQNGTLFALLVLIAVFATLNPRFFSLQNGATVLLQIAELGIVAIPLAFLVMTGTLDLSIGSVASLGAVISAFTVVGTQNILLGLLAAVAVGLVTGAINGFLVSFLGLNPLVVTLGFLSVWGGLALFLTNGATVTGMGQAFRDFGLWRLGPANLQLIVLILVLVFGWFVLNRRPFGRNVLAIGGNAKAARLMGVKVRQTRFVLFIITGVAAAVVGFLLTAKLQSAPPTVGTGMEIQALTVVLLGGVAMEGGAGRISGVIAGLLFVGVLRNGLVILGVSQFLQTILIGATLVVAILLDSSIQRLLKASWNNMVRPASS
ncbi:ABC transporter permease [Herbiconiux moechotypicola]|uniref:ABC transporter permease n=1 Tax=Herbiconiux moechotypicola TaxID=637393 RepID=A0ABN3E2I0_9MICO|nr:ABC transporter permease [Herbiconiux moechotypicola]MCS5731320.1 ABC transporter permease [Herbiconiux moechotypicola]